MEKRELHVEIRKGIGKGATHRLRMDKKIPAVFYGPHVEKPVALALDAREWTKLSQMGSNTLFTLKSKGKSSLDGRVALVKDQQFHHLTESCIHVDFYEIRPDEKIKVNIKVSLINKAKGVAEGGVLQQIRRELEVYCLPDQIPEKIEADVTELQIGDSLHINEITLPKGITVIGDVNYTLAAVVPPEELAKVLEEAAETPETEVTVAGKADEAEKAEAVEAKAAAGDKPGAKAEKKAEKKGEADKPKEAKPKDK